MYIQLDKEKQKLIIKQSIAKAGSYRKLAKELKIPLSSICAYENGRVILKERFQKIISFLKLNQSKLDFKELDDNWRQVIGGKNCVKSKKQKGTYEEQLRKAQQSGALKLKDWHKSMKKNNPRKYYEMQHSKFKMIAGYKFIAKKGHKVRNLFEKKVADILHELNINYEYEPLVKSRGKNVFPDFVVNKKTILECTAWRNETKAYQLRDKIEYLKNNYRVFVVIPKGLYRYYRILDKRLIHGLDEFVPVAQTFHSS
jgi:hypothetical protein